MVKPHGGKKKGKIMRGHKQIKKNLKKSDKITLHFGREGIKEAADID